MNLQITNRYCFTVLIAAILLAYLCISVYSHSLLAENLAFFLGAVSLIQVMVIAAFLLAAKNLELLTTKYVLLLAIIIHVIGIAGHPVFEDDYFRYLWDAYTLYTYGSPYSITPESFFSDATVPENFQAILDYINNPSLPTIYGPTLQYSFLLAYLIDPANIYILKFIYAIANVAIIFICLQFAKPHYVFLYVCSPLVFKEILLTAHPDGFAVALLVAALWARHKHYYYITGALLGLSIGAKIFAVLLLPFLILRQPVKVISGVIGILLLLYLPIIKNGASDLLGLAYMATDWEFNSALWGLFRIYFSVEITRWLCASILLVTLAIYGLQFLLQQKNNPTQIPRGDIIFGSFLLCAPVINPWYLVWLLPFAVIRPTITVWYASFIVLLAYITPLYWPTLGINGAYNHPTFIRWFEFGSLFLVFLFEYYWRQSKTTKSSIA